MLNARLDVASESATERGSGPARSFHYFLSNIDLGSIGGYQKFCSIIHWYKGSV